MLASTVFSTTSLWTYAETVLPRNQLVGLNKPATKGIDVIYVAAAKHNRQAKDRANNEFIVVDITTNIMESQEEKTDR
jgi:hypothetical protein